MIVDAKKTNFLDWQNCSTTFVFHKQRSVQDVLLCIALRSHSRCEEIGSSKLLAQYHIG